MQYHTTPGDVSNRYYWDAASTTADDDDLVIKVTALAVGRWLKVTPSGGSGGRQYILYEPTLITPTIEVVDPTSIQLGENTAGTGNELDITSIEEGGIWNLHTTILDFYGSPSILKMIAMDPGTGVTLYHQVDNGVGDQSEPTARTAKRADGSFEVFNPGTGLWERVLSLKDIPSLIKTGIKTGIGFSYTFISGDEDRSLLHQETASSTSGWVIPLNATVAFPIGSIIRVATIAPTNGLSITVAVGVTFLGVLPTNILNDEIATLMKLDTDTWGLI